MAGWSDIHRHDDMKTRDRCGSSPPYWGTGSHIPGASSGADGEHVKHMGALNETVIELTVQLVERPYAKRRASAHCVGESFWRVTVRFAFNEVPDLLEALEDIEEFDSTVNFKKVIYFGARDLVVRDTRHPRFAHWLLKLFALLFRNPVKTMDRFYLPPTNFVEIAREIAI